VGNVFDVQSAQTETRNSVNCCSAQCVRFEIWQFDVYANIFYDNILAHGANKYVLRLLSI
jgi:hypothetical protein